MKKTVFEFLKDIKDGIYPEVIKLDGDVWYLQKNGRIIEYSKDKEYNTYTLDWNYYIEYRKFDMEVEILPEENDGWKDIEELKEFEHLIDYEGTIHVQKNREAINQLIKNQKYLKEKLEDKQ